MVYRQNANAIHVYWSELEIQCIAAPETYAGWKVRRADEIAGMDEAPFLLSEGESLVDVKSSKKFQRRNFSCDGLPSYPSIDGPEASPEVSRVTSDCRDT